MKKSGRRKFITLLALALAGGICYWITDTTQASEQTVRINYAVLGIIVAMIVAAYFGGIRRVGKINRDISRIMTEMKEISSKFAVRGKLKSLKFQEEYLKEKYESFLSYCKTASDADIENFINSYEVCTWTHRRVWEIFADFMTSIGILGTFVGLIVGLQGFNLNDLNNFSTSVSPLLDGIKVAFLTSVYGISLSLAYSYGLLSTYEEMEEVMGNFLEKFHILWGKEPDSNEKVLAEQKQQTEMLRELTETFQEQLAASFEEVITPALMKLNDQFGTYSEGQRQMLKDAAAQFAEEFKNSFVGGFTQFEKNLDQINQMQTKYMTFIDRSTNILTQTLNTQSKATNEYILKSAQQQEDNIKEIDSLFRKMNNSMTAFSESTDRCYQAMVSVTDHLSGNQNAMEQAMQAFMNEISQFETMQGNHGKDYTEILKAMNEAFRNGMSHIYVSVNEEKELLEKTLEEIKRLQGMKKQGISEKTERSETGWEAEIIRELQESPQGDVLNQILTQMQELVQIERERERKRGFRRFFSRKNTNVRR